MMMTVVEDRGKTTPPPDTSSNAKVISKQVGSFEGSISARSMPTKERRRPRIAVAVRRPISNLLFLFGPNAARKYNDATPSITTMDATLDDVLATMATGTTPNTTKNTNNLPQEEYRQVMHKVSFCTKKPQVHHIMSRQDISANEYMAAWYSRAELDSISDSCLKQIHSITRSNKSDTFVIDNHGIRTCTNIDDEEEESCCLRGLESFTPSAAMAKKMNRSSSVQAVLIEQNRQKEQQRLACEGGEEEVVDQRHQQHQNDGDHAHQDAAAIRMIYHRISASSQLWAHVMALKDQREVEDMMMDDDECCRDGEGKAAVLEDEKIVKKTPLAKQGDCGAGRRRRVSRSHSSNSTNSTRGGEQPKKRSKLRAVTTTTIKCKVDVARPPLAAEKAGHQMVMALAA